MIKIYLSSTYRDLVFERREIRLELEYHGFKVLMMEDHPNVTNTFRWSVDTIREADIYILLFANSAGTVTSTKGIPGPKFEMPYVYWEAKWSRHYTVRQFFYQLHRPFPDENILISHPDERKEYKESLNFASSSNSFSPQPSYIRGVEELLISIQLLKCWKQLCVMLSVQSQE